MLAEEQAPKVKTEVQEAKPTIDPQSETKLKQAYTRLLTLVKTERPRFYPAFERMEIRGHIIAIAVPSSELHDEILRNQTGLLTKMAREAGVEGMVELEVSINEEIRADKPIKLEDRLKYLTDKNPRIGTLRTALDMDFE